MIKLAHYQDNYREDVNEITHVLPDCALSYDSFRRIGGKEVGLDTLHVSKGEMLNE